MNQAIPVKLLHPGLFSPLGVASRNAAAKSGYELDSSLLHFAKPVAAETPSESPGVSPNGSDCFQAGEAAAPAQSKLLALLQVTGLSSACSSAKKAVSGAAATSSVQTPSAVSSFVGETFKSETELPGGNFYLKCIPTPDEQEYDFKVLVAQKKGDACPGPDEFYRSMVVGKFDPNNSDRVRLRLGTCYTETYYYGGDTESHFRPVYDFGQGPNNPEVDVALKETAQGVEFTMPKGWIEDEAGAISSPLVFRARSLSSVGRAGDGI